MIVSLEQLEREFNLGLEAAKDPTNEAALSGGEAVTTVRSRWFFQRCPVSGHTFRRGDVVTINSAGAVRLTAAESLLALERESSVERAEVAVAAAQATPALHEETERAFFGGLLEAWPPPQDLQVIRLGAGNPLVTAPAGFRRRTCAVCGHSLRPGDLVIICPCSPQRPLCEAAIHRDPIHSLHCWDNWNPESRRTHCPITSRKL